MGDSLWPSGFLSATVAPFGLQICWKTYIYSNSSYRPQTSSPNVVDFSFIPAVSWIGILGCAFNTQQFWRSCHCWRRLGRVFGDTGVWRAMCKAVGVFYNQFRLFIGWFHAPPAPPLFMLGNWWPIIYSTKNHVYHMLHMYMHCIANIYIYICFLFIHWVWDVKEDACAPMAQRAAPVSPFESRRGTWDGKMFGFGLPWALC